MFQLCVSTSLHSLLICGMGITWLWEAPLSDGCRTISSVSASWLAIIYPSLLTHTCVRWGGEGEGAHWEKRGRGPSISVSLQHKPQAAFLISGLERTLGAVGCVLGLSSQRLHQCAGLLGPENGGGGARLPVVWAMGNSYSCPLLCHLSNSRQPSLPHTKDPRWPLLSPITAP